MPINVSTTNQNVEVSTTGQTVQATVSGGQGPPGPSGAGNWSEISGKPAEFPPEDHSHAIADVTGLSADLASKVPLAGGAMNASASLTFADATADSEVGGWGFGVQITADNTKYATVEPTAITVHNSSGSTQLTPAGLTLPNSTQAIVGSFDNSTGGANGISLICAVGNELNWQGGRLRNVQVGGDGTPQPIFIDSPLELPGEDGSVSISGNGITFPDQTKQTVAWTGSMSYDDLDDLPTLFSGDYDDLTGKPTLGSAASAATTEFAAASHGHALAAITDAGTAASKNVPATGNAGSTEVVLGSDTRLADSRTPTAHKSNHSTGGSDALSPSDIGAAAVSHSHNASDITSGTISQLRLPATLVYSLDSRLTDARIPTGAAGGDLAGTYPNPTIAPGAVVEVDLANNVRNQIFHPFLFGGM